MASTISEVDACNVALSNIGQGGVVSSIAPPDGSAASTHCARFFPIARDEVLEAHDWNFATRRKSLTHPDEAEIPAQYTYAYIIPPNCVRVICVLPQTYIDEDLSHLNYSIEGTTLFCNEDNVVLKYIAEARDVSAWPPAVMRCVIWKLSQYLAGAMVKGDVNMRVYCAKQYGTELTNAMGLDANTQNAKPEHIPPWLQDR